MTFTLGDDGSLVVVDQQLDAQGKPIAGESRQWNISPAQIAAHRRDPTFEAALQASSLTPAQKAALPS